MLDTNRRNMKALSLTEVKSRLQGVAYDCLSLESFKGKTYIAAMCPEHGAFRIAATHALKGAGCKQCGSRASAQTRADSFESVVAKAKAVHGDRYQYLEVLQGEGRRLIKFICQDHGEVVKTINKHLIGQGCPTCARLSQGLKRSLSSRENPRPSHRRYTLEDYSSKASSVHNNAYKYKALEFSEGRGYVVAECPIHGEFKLLSAKHLRGGKCPGCASISRTTKRTYSFEEVVAKAKSVHGDRYSYKCLVETGRRQAVTAVCSDHGEFTKSTALLLSGRGCPTCGLAEKALKLQTPFETYVLQASKVHSGKYNYKRIERKDAAMIVYDCPNHGEQTQNMHSHLAGAECKLCSYATTGVSRRIKEEVFFSKALEVHGGKYQYTALFFEDGESKVKYACTKHGEITQKATVHLRGSGCPECSWEDLGLAKRDTLEIFTKKAERVHGTKFNYIGLDHTATPARVTYRCQMHGEHTQGAAQHLYGDGCPACKGKVSLPNLQIREFLTSLNAEVTIEHRFDSSRKFFDVALPEAKVVIEYNGNYWHSSERIASSAHLEKTRIAEANGYRCIHIRSDEWENKRTAVEYLLKSAAGKVSEKVYARKTKVVKPSKLEASRMLDTYHIQGAVLHGDFYGLEEDGQLVAVMVFSRNTSSRREKASDSHVELTRYVTCKQVVGGFTKLLNTFLKDNPEVVTVSSYSDVRIFQGGVYEKAGFVKMHTTPPDYMYLEKDRLYHKANYQKSKLAKRFGAAACEGKTERQITEEQGIYRVYDCGKVKWLYTRK
jgi:very-short-patch-repair endonuclease/Zn finger protein HypA/HybF involved in hydrogenase expression